MDAKEDIKQRLAIEDVVGRYVELKRAGRNFKGLSPFNSERTPSFIVSPEKQIWHDFSSGRGGDIFSFVMEMEGLDFRQALELLARQAGVDLESYNRSTGSTNKDQKQRLLDANELAAKFYELYFSKSQLAKDYVFGQRQFSKETTKTWRLGYSPAAGGQLIEFLKSRGFTEAELKKAGLINSYGRDMFRGRLMIPLCDSTGQVIGFTARQLKSDDNSPKYINTPATTLYDKSQHVFGLHHAKQAIRKQKFAVLVEGNLDVIMSHQAGQAMAVATAGTALTQLQLKALKRLTGDIRLCFDADRAGRQATERALPIASKVGVDLSVIELPSGKDPDELIKGSAELWPKIINQAEPALDWLIGHYEQELNLKQSSGKKKFRDQMAEIISQLSDPVERQHYIDLVASKLGVDSSALSDVMLGKTPPLKLRPGIDRASSGSKDLKTDSDQLNQIKTQNRLLAILLLRPTLREVGMKHLRAEMIRGTEANYLFNFLINNPDFKGNPEEAELLREVSDYVKMELLQYETLYDGLELNELHFEVIHLQAQLIEQYVKTQKQEIIKQLKAADESLERELLNKARQLDRLLRTSQEENIDGQEN